MDSTHHAASAAWPDTYSRRKLNSLYREIPLKDTTFRLLRKYFNAMGNLYGIIPLRKAFEIISSQSPNLVSRDEFLAFAEIARHECEDYCLLGQDELYTDGRLDDVMDREIIDMLLVSGELDQYHAMLKAQRGKPYYIPRKQELLAYDDPFYYVPSRASENLLTFFTESLHMDETQAAAVFDELLYGIRCLNVEFSQAMSHLKEMGIVLRGMEQAEAFIKIYQEFHNHTRMQSNRGHTPDELFSMQPPEDRIPKAISFGPNIRRSLQDGSMDANELRQGILTADFLNEELRPQMLRELAAIMPTVMPAKKKVKIGRNDLCPCGSGKKYKRCCGR